MIETLFISVVFSIKILKRKEELEGDFFKTYTPDKRLRAVFDFIVCMQELDMFLNNCVGVLVSVLYPKW